MKHTASYIPDYPRPQLVRRQWVNLNGEWDFAFDADGSGLKKDYDKGFAAQRKIIVPFAYQVKASGIGDPTLCEHIWYERTLDLKPRRGKKILLHLEGCDYETHVWLNGEDCGSAVGAYHRLTFDLTRAAKDGGNLLVIAVSDDYSKEKPRGKQRWQSADHGCWYIDTSGIYKTVWMEEVDVCHIRDARITPDVGKRSVAFELDVDTAGRANVAARVEISYDGKRVAGGKAAAVDGKCRLDLDIPESDVHLWNVGAPELYDAAIELAADGEAVDRAESYFGMREIKAERGRILLNGKPLYQKLVLDQGYWQDSGLTPPDERALEADIVSMLGMGFNGCRKHEKIEDERFMYYADVYGYVVWCEMPSVYELTDASKAALMSEWQTVVKQMCGHPSILCWVCFNESWGIERIKTDKAVQDYVNSVYRATKAIDSTRFAITNDGWEHTLSDILTIHHYTQSGEELHSYFDTVEKCAAEKYDGHDRGAYADGYGHDGKPIMITEFGGTAFVGDAVGAKWGYGNGVNSDGEYEERLRGLVRAIDSIPFMCGYCYTQLSDVYHEVNGLTDFARKPKLAPEKFRSIFGSDERKN